MAAPAKELLKISELAERAEVPVATVRHYLREGLLPEPVKTSKNMAYYPPEFVERIRTIKRLQEERFMPLRVIKEALLAERTPKSEILERYRPPRTRARPPRRGGSPEPGLQRLLAGRTCASSKPSPAFVPKAGTRRRASAPATSLG